MCVTIASMLWLASEFAIVMLRSSTVAARRQQAKMSQRQIISAIESFFTSYREAFERADAAAVAEHFGESVHVASDTGSGVRVGFMTAAEWRGVIEQLLARYQALGVSKAEPKNVEVAGVSARLAQASVHWALSARDGRAVYEFEALYTLASDGTRWRIVAIAHDEFARSRQVSGAPS